MCASHHLFPTLILPYGCQQDTATASRLNHAEQLGVSLNSLALEFKISAEPINTGDKMVVPRREPVLVLIMFYSPFLQSKRL